MSKQIEALKLALEAFEADASNENFLILKHRVREALAEQPAQKTCLVANESCKHGSWCSEVYCQEHCTFVEQPAQQYNPTSDHRMMENAQGDLERIKLVQTGVGIGKPEQEPVIDHSCKDVYELIMKWADIYAAQTGRIYSEAAQDPTKTARMADERTMLACAVAQALSQPAQQQEPVAWMWKDGTVTTDPDRADGTWTPLYTSPPASKPLTDAQIGSVAADIWGSVLIAPQSYQAFARAIEAAHGIKEKRND